MTSSEASVSSRAGHRAGHGMVTCAAVCVNLRHGAGQGRTGQAEPWRLLEATEIFLSFGNVMQDTFFTQHAGVTYAAPPRSGGRRLVLCRQPPVDCMLELLTENFALTVMSVISSHGSRRS